MKQLLKTVALKTMVLKKIVLKTMVLKKAVLIATLVTGSAWVATAQASSPSPLKTPKLLASLPFSFNSPASFTLDAYNNLLFTSPNLHNDAFIKQGLMAKPQSPTIGLIDENNKVSTWYTFKPQDLEAKSGAVVPMGIAKGPDGNMYIADMQLWAGGESRILRVNVVEGKAVDVDVVVKGLSFPNGVAWRGDELFISDTVLFSEKGKPTISGVYRVKLKEMSAQNPLQLSGYKDAKNNDKHLIKQFTSNGSLGFGANGIAVDDEGNLYTGIMEDGTVYKTIFDERNHIKNTVLFSQGLVASDGMHWDKRTQALYITDLFANAAYAIKANGELVLLAKNGDTNGAKGELDGPGEIIVRGKEAYIGNFDAAFGTPTMVNTQPDAPITLSVIKID